MRAIIVLITVVMTLGGHDLPQKPVSTFQEHADLTPTLRRKVVELEQQCHAKLTSGYRPASRVAGSARPSLHSVYPARAADLVGDYRCVYAHLAGWPGGYSVDADRAHHVHISYSPPGSGPLGGHEWHVRFHHRAPDAIARLLNAL